MISLDRENQSVRMAHSSCYSTFMVDSAGVTRLIITGFKKVHVFLQSVTYHLQCRLDCQRYGKLAAG